MSTGPSGAAACPGSRTWVGQSFAVGVFVIGVVLSDRSVRPASKRWLRCDLDATWGAGRSIGTTSFRVGSASVAHRPQPEQQAPPVQRLRVKYAKRGRA